MQEHVELFGELTAEDWGRWKNQPVTRAFFAYLGDVHGEWEQLALALLISGAYRQNDSHEDRNPDVVRGKLLTLKLLQGISLGEIRGFYGQETPDSQEVSKPNGVLPNRGVTGY